MLNMQTQDKAMLLEAVSLFFAGVVNATIPDPSAGEHTPFKAKWMHPHRNIIDGASGSFAEQTGSVG